LTGTAGAKNLAFAYDSNGNTLTENNRTYGYDKNNRLIHAVENSSTLDGYLSTGRGGGLIINK
jgi:hypothetical protein